MRWTSLSFAILLACSSASAQERCREGTTRDESIAVAVGAIVFGGLALIGGTIALPIAIDDWIRVESPTDGALWADYRESYHRAGPLVGGGVLMILLGGLALVGGSIALTSPCGDVEAAVGPGSLTVRW